LKDKVRREEEDETPTLVRAGPQAPRAAASAAAYRNGIGGEGNSSFPKMEALGNGGEGNSEEGNGMRDADAGKRRADSDQRRGT